jgi:hypothetical protein
MVRSIVIVICAFAALGAPAVAPHGAEAQDLETGQSEARRLFEEGLALAEVDRWAEALSAFRRSAALVPRASTSYNIANALYRLDRPVEALEELDAYDRMPEVRGDENARKRGETLRELLENNVAEVHLRVAPAAAMVFIDGRPSVLLGADRKLVLDPGMHSLRVSHEGYQPYRREIQVERGSRSTYAVELRVQQSSLQPEQTPLSTISPARAAPTDEPRPASPPAHRDDRKPFVKRPGFWVMIGVVAAAGIGAGVAVAVTRNNDSPSCGTTGDCATTQGLTVKSF